MPTRTKRGHGPRVQITIYLYPSLHKHSTRKSAGVACAKAPQSPRKQLRPRSSDRTPFRACSALGDVRVHPCDEHDQTNEAGHRGK